MQNKFGSVVYSCYICNVKKLNILKLFSYGKGI